MKRVAEGTLSLHYAFIAPSSAEVKNSWSCTFTPPVHLHGVVLN